MGTTPTPSSNSYMSPRLERWRNKTRSALSVVAIGSLPFLILELQRDELARQDRLLIGIINVVVFVVFAVDYFVGLYLTDDRKRFVRNERLELLLVISQGLVLVPWLVGFGVLRALRATRLIRAAAALCRVVAIGGMASRHGRQMLRDNAFSLSFGTAGLTWLASAVAFTMVEDVGPNGRLESFFDGLWWSLATITTVGYGDVFPVTGAGRIIGALTMVVGISVFAVVTARIAAVFTKDESEAPTDLDQRPVASAAN